MRERLGKALAIGAAGAALGASADRIEQHVAPHAPSEAQRAWDEHNLEQEEAILVGKMNADVKSGYVTAIPGETTVTTVDGAGTESTDTIQNALLETQPGGNDGSDVAHPSAVIVGERMGDEVHIYDPKDSSVKKIQILTPDGKLISLKQAISEGHYADIASGRRLKLGRADSEGHAGFIPNGDGAKQFDGDIGKSLTY